MIAWVYVWVYAKSGCTLRPAFHPAQTQSKTKKDMAGLMQRDGMWHATWKVGRKSVRKSTGVAVKPQGMTERKARAMAQEQADKMEMAAKGAAPVDKLMDAVRSAAELAGMGGEMPTLREYLGAFPRTATEGSEINRRRAFTVFLEYMRAKADKRLDLVSVGDCEGFCRWALGKWSRGTVERHKNALGHAFRRAVEIDDLMRKNPMRAVSLPAVAAAVCPERGADKQKRYPFTLAEIRRLIAEAPAPWCDMVAASWYTGGLRLSDVCLMRWDAVEWSRGYISLVEKKTKKERCIPLCAGMRDMLAKRRELTAGDEYVFPAMAHFYLGGAAGYVSTQFTALLRSMGIIEQKETRSDGERHTLAAKSFHSIRHAFVTWGRSCGLFTADVIRDAVGHDSEEVERGYITVALELQAQVMNAAERAMKAAGREALKGYARKIA